MNEYYLPCGFRCFCKMYIRNRLKIKQLSMPFDYGFFSVSSVIKFMEADKIEMNLENTTPCIKTEEFHHKNKLGINFETSNYTQIDDFIEKNGYDNSYLDSSRGYYTLCNDYDFVLAHYNWHKSSTYDYNKGVTDPEKNMDRINLMLSRRKARVLEGIDGAEKINLCFYNNQKYEFMKIDQTSYTLSNDSMNLLKSYFEGRYKNKLFEIVIFQGNWKTK